MVGSSLRSALVVVSPCFSLCLSAPPRHRGWLDSLWTSAALRVSRWPESMPVLAWAGLLFRVPEGRRDRWLIPIDFSS